MIFLYAFLVGGFICLIGQFIIDRFKLTPAHITCLFVVLGALFDVFGLYDALIDFAGAGALVPISSFGHSVLHAALESTKEFGYIGIFMGMLDITAPGIVSAILFSFIASLFFKPRG